MKSARLSEQYRGRVAGILPAAQKVIYPLSIDLSQPKLVGWIEGQKGCIYVFYFHPIKNAHIKKMSFKKRLIRIKLTFLCQSQKTTANFPD